MLKTKKEAIKFQNLHAGLSFTCVKQRLNRLHGCQFTAVVRYSADGELPAGSARTRVQTGSAIYSGLSLDSNRSVHKHGLISEYPADCD